VTKLLRGDKPLALIPLTELLAKTVGSSSFNLSHQICQVAREQDCWQVGCWKGRQYLKGFKGLCSRDGKVGIEA
jgi:hypothetical protein